MLEPLTCNFQKLKELRGASELDFFQQT